MSKILSMQFLVYLLSYPLLILISFLPFRLLYVLSDIVFVFVYYVFGYRKKVVQANLLLAFPDYTDGRRKEIEIKFYKHMCDMFLEMMKTMSISQQEMEERFVFKNLDVYLDLEKKGKSIAMMMAHYASYEWAILMNTKISFGAFAIYKRLSNPYFDKLIRKIRSNFKTRLIHTRESVGVIERNEIQKNKGLYGFISDQSPRSRGKRHLGLFMGIEVPVFTGAEMLAKRFDMNVIYLKVTKVKRGFYEAEIEILAEDVKNVPDYQITDLFLKKVESQIIEAPEYYLWTHKRWKHQDKKRV
ncbi:lysophospholipid acyltransferase family protein [Flavobacterium sp. GSA192]|uniref:lysophospholipid acyltransferase family protein n=1 Tax=Flavobacterium sp. GSA192 TaxID=2576304 RepID=UPI002938EE2F|nr:lysophospholipid acyltransferase family protein [Flavobacterium sp. GSA192]